MRDDSQLYDLYEVEDDVDERPSRLGAAIAATVALALLAGVITWSYRLGVRDANDVPVIRAAEGPSRVRPEDPGGAQFEHQGRAVYGAMSGAAPAPAEVTLAPAPEPLADEDETFLALAEGETPPPQIEIAAGNEVDMLVAAVLGDGAAVAAPAPDYAPPAAVGGAVGAGPERPLPAPRPAVRSVAAAPAPGASAVPAAPVQTEALGGALIQLGAYLSHEDAARMWEVLARRNPDLLGPRTPSVSPLQGANRVLHRLRAGPFGSVEEARAFCAALQARGEDCLVSGPN